MSLHFTVDKIYHSSERRRLAATGRARDEHEALFETRNVHQHLWKPQLIKTGYLVGYGPESGCIPPVLFEYIYPEPPIVSKAKGKIELQELFEDLALFVAQDVIDHLVYRLRVQRG